MAKFGNPSGAGRTRKDPLPSSNKGGPSSDAHFSSRSAEPMTLTVQVAGRPHRLVKRAGVYYGTDERNVPLNARHDYVGSLSMGYQNRGGKPKPSITGHEWVKKTPHVYEAVGTDYVIAVEDFSGDYKDDPTAYLVLSDVQKDESWALGYGSHAELQALAARLVAGGRKPSSSPATKSIVHGKQSADGAYVMGGKRWTRRYGVLDTDGNVVHNTGSLEDAKAHADALDKKTKDLYVVYDADAKDPNRGVVYDSELKGAP